MTTELDALAALLAAATPGPWRHYRDKLRPQFSSRINEIQAKQKAPVVAWSGFDDSDRSEDKHAANAALIVAAVNALPELIEAARREAALVKAAQSLVDALEYVPGSLVGGKIALVVALLHDNAGATEPAGDEVGEP